MELGGQLNPPPRAPARPVAPPPSTAEGARLPMCDVFSVISGVLRESWAPPPSGSSTPPPHRAAEGEGGATDRAMEDTPTSVPFSPLSPPLPLQETLEVQPARGAGNVALPPEGDTPRTFVSKDP